MNLALTEAGSVVYLNGEFLPLAQAGVSPLDRGFLYGDGLFETMRAEGGDVLHWPEHRKRLYRSASSLRISLSPSSPHWENLFHELLDKNRLLDKVARVKVVVTRGVAVELGLPRSSAPTVCVVASEYAPPEPGAYMEGWRLHVFKEHFAPPTARFKSLNYLYYLMARQSALDAGAHEALILGPRGNVAEAATGSILARTDGEWWAPVSQYQLPGVTLRQIVYQIYDSGMDVKFRPASPAELASAQTVWILNSLVGVMPVSYLDGYPLEDPAAEEAAAFREVYFRQGLPQAL